MRTYRRAGEGRRARVQQAAIPKMKREAEEKARKAGSWVVRAALTAHRSSRVGETDLETASRVAGVEVEVDHPERPSKRCAWAVRTEADALVGDVVLEGWWRTLAENPATGHGPPSS